MATEGKSAETLRVYRTSVAGCGQHLIAQKGNVPHPDAVSRALDATGAGAGCSPDSQPGGSAMTAAPVRPFHCCRWPDESVAAPHVGLKSGAECWFHRGHIHGVAWDATSSAECHEVPSVQ